MHFLFGVEMCMITAKKINSIKVSVIQNSEICWVIYQRIIRVSLYYSPPCKVIHKRMQPHAHMYTYVWVYVYADIYTHAHLYNTNKYIHISTSTHMHIHKYIYVCILCARLCKSYIFFFWRVPDTETVGEVGGAMIQWWWIYDPMQHERT